MPVDNRCVDHGALVYFDQALGGNLSAVWSDQAISIGQRFLSAHPNIVSGDVSNAKDDAMVAGLLPHERMLN